MARPSIEAVCDVHLDKASFESVLEAHVDLESVDESTFSRFINDNWFERLAVLGALSRTFSRLV